MEKMVKVTCRHCGGQNATGAFSSAPVPGSCKVCNGAGFVIVMDRAEQRRKGQ